MRQMVIRKRLLIAPLFLTLNFLAPVAGQDSSPDPPKPRFVRHHLIDPTPSDWKSVANPDAVTVLEIIDTTPESRHVDDDSLVNLAQFPNLRTLVIHSASITDRGLASIAEMKHISALVFYDCRITDDGVRQLKPLEKLQTIGFLGTTITEKGATLLTELLPNTNVDQFDYGRPGKVFDGNGCLTTDFLIAHFGFKPKPNE